MESGRWLGASSARSLQHVFTEKRTSSLDVVGRDENIGSGEGNNTHKCCCRGSYARWMAGGICFSRGEGGL